MFKMRQSLLPAILLTTITLSSSNVLPILSINKVDTDTLSDDQDTDNTFNNKHDSINPNIFYKVFIGTAKDNTPKKTQISRLKYLDNDNNQERKILSGIIEDEGNIDDDGFRKEQWHNYPRQLDRLQKDSFVDRELEKILDVGDLEQTKRTNVQNDLYQYTSDDIFGKFDSDIIAGPLFVLKIRLAYLNDNLNKHNSDKYLNTDLDPYELVTENDNEATKEENLLFDNDKSARKVKRKEKLSREDLKFLENSSNEKKSVKKRIFSLWSRLQSLSHRGHELHHRRHLYAFYGLPEDGGGGGGALTAETRAMMRPPGSPLRWG